MKRITIITLLLLAALSAFGQKRVYLNKGDTYEDIFVVNLGTEENPVLEMSIQMYLISDSDTTFVVFSEKDFENAATYFRAVTDVYDKERANARRNKVERLDKPIDLYPPELRIRWTQHPKSDRWSEWRQIRTYQTEITHDLPLVFNVTKGIPLVVGEFQVLDENDPEVMGFIHFLLDSKSLKTINRCIRPENIWRVFEKRK